MRAAVRERQVTPAALDELIARDLEGLSRDALQALAPALKEARSELERALTGWLDSEAEHASERFTAYRYRQALAQLNGALKKVAELEPKLVGVLEAEGGRAGRLATKHVVQQVERYAKVYEGSGYQIPLDQAAAIAEGRSLLIPRYRTSAKRYVGNVRDDIRQQLAVGLLKGETFDEMTARLVRHGGPTGWVALRGVKGTRGAIVEHIGEGLFRRYNYWAARIVRTEVLSAYNTVAERSIAQLHKQDRDLKRRWNAANDWRTCIVCRSLDGKVAAVGEDFGGGYSTAPAHPNCRCNIGPWKEAWDEALEATKKANAEGPPKSVEEQVRKVEIEELAPRRKERVVAFDAKGNRLFTQDGNQDKVALTLDQVRRVPGARVTHNHPTRGERYDTLSPADVALFAHHRAASVSAVSTEPEGIVRYTVSMKPGASHPKADDIRQQVARLMRLKTLSKLGLVSKGQLTGLGAHLEALHEAWLELAQRHGLVYRREVLQPRGKAKK